MKTAAGRFLDGVPRRVKVGAVAFNTRTDVLEAPVATIVDAKGRTQPAPPDPETLQAVAEQSGGQSFAVEDADALTAVYERLGSHVATEREPREVTAAFAGGALALVAGGALLSLHWFRRPV